MKRVVQTFPKSDAERIVGEYVMRARLADSKAYVREKRVLLYGSVLGVAYAMHRWKQIEEAGFEFLILKCGVDYCPVHALFDGIVLPIGHQFWDIHAMPVYPGDSCRILGARGPASASRLGGDPRKTLPADWMRIPITR